MVSASVTGSLTQSVYMQGQEAMMQIALNLRIRMGADELCLGVQSASLGETMP